MVYVVEVVLGYIVKFAVENGEVYGLTVCDSSGEVLAGTVWNKLPGAVYAVILAVAKGVAEAWAD